MSLVENTFHSRRHFTKKKQFRVTSYFNFLFPFLQKKEASMYAQTTGQRQGVPTQGVGLSPAQMRLAPQRVQEPDYTYGEGSNLNPTVPTPEMVQNPPPYNPYHGGFEEARPILHEVARKKPTAPSLLYSNIQGTFSMPITSISIDSEIHVSSSHPSKSPPLFFTLRKHLLP